MVIVKSCFGLSLHEAGVAIGWLNALICVVESVAFILLLLDVPYLAEKLVRDKKQQRHVAVGNMRLFCYVVLGIYESFILIDLIACALLLIGIERNKRYLLLPWLFSNSMSVVFQLGSSLFLATGTLLAAKHRNLKITVIIVNLCITGIHIWMWIVIFSLHVHIRHVLRHEPD